MKVTFYLSLKLLFICESYLASTIILKVLPRSPRAATRIIVTDIPVENCKQSWNWNWIVTAIDLDCLKDINNNESKKHAETC